jgi:hypothetical protein
MRDVLRAGDTVPLFWRSISESGVPQRRLWQSGWGGSENAASPYREGSELFNLVPAFNVRKWPIAAV